MSVPLDVPAIQAMMDASPFIVFLGLRAESVDPVAQEFVASMKMRPECERGAGSGQWHGGPIAAAIDTVGDFALVMMLGRGLPTVNFRVDFLRPAVGTGLRLVGRVQRSGRSIGVADVDVFDDHGALVAIGRCCFSTMAA